MSALFTSEYISVEARVQSYIAIRDQPGGVEEYELAKARRMLNITIGDINDFEEQREMAHAYAHACGDIGLHDS